MASNIKIDRELDLKGEVCPYTFVRSKLALEEPQVGQVLRVLVDHEPATSNVPQSMENEGQEVLGVDRIEDNAWAIIIRKAAG